MARAVARTPSTSILAEGGDVSFYETPDDIAAHVEAIDVREGIYRAWLADGSVITLDAPQKWGRVTAHISHDVDADGLRAKLLELARAVSLADAGLDADPLDELLEKVMAAQLDWHLRHRGPIRTVLERLLPRLFTS